MENKLISDFTIIWSFRNRVENIKSSVESANIYCPNEVNFCLIDANSDDEVIRKVRAFVSSMFSREVKVCESAFRSSLLEAWNLGIMLSASRYVIFVSSDVVFLKSGWFEELHNKLVIEKYEYVLLENHAVFGFDKLAILKMGWFDESFGNGPHFDCDFMIRSTESGVRLTGISNNGFYDHSGSENVIIRSQRLREEVPNRLPMNNPFNDVVFKEKWATNWPGWSDLIKKGEFNLPHPPTHISEVSRKRPEIDPHPFYTKKIKKLYENLNSGA